MDVVASPGRLPALGGKRQAMEPLGSRHHDRGVRDPHCTASDHPQSSCTRSRCFVRARSRRSCVSPTRRLRGQAHWQEAASEASAPCAPSGVQTPLALRPGGPALVCASLSAAYRRDRGPCPPRVADVVDVARIAGVHVSAPALSALLTSASSASAGRGRRLPVYRRCGAGCLH